MEKAGGYPAPKTLLLTATLIPHFSFDRFTYSEALILISLFYLLWFMFPPNVLVEDLLTRSTLPGAFGSS